MQRISDLHDDAREPRNSREIARGPHRDDPACLWTREELRGHRHAVEFKRETERRDRNAGVAQMATDRLDERVAG